MAPPKSNDSLGSFVKVASLLLTDLESILHDIALGKSASTPWPEAATATTPSSTDSVSLAHDAASLIKAHTTKLSLLIINEPFTPSAILKVLKELIAGPVPSLAHAAQACDAERYTHVARQDLAWRCHRVLKELNGLISKVPTDGKVLPQEKRDGSGGGIGSIGATGVIWAACDDVISLKQMGIVGLLVKKVEEYRDTLKDVLEELKEWKEEGEQQRGDEDDPVEYVTNQLDTTHLDAQDMLDDLMNPDYIPRDDPEKIGERLESCLTRLRLTTLLYSAIVKRRLKMLPLPTEADSTAAKRVDEVFPILKQISNRFNEVACAFYDMDPDVIDETMDACFFDAFAASEMLMKSWDGKTDEFTTWAEKFQVSIKKNSAESP